jgi:FemAB family protein
VEYTPTFVRYQESYFFAEDASLIIEHDRRPVAVLPLAVYEGNLTSNGGDILPPLMVAGLPEKVEKKIVADCLRHVDAECLRIEQALWRSTEIVRQEGLSLWHRRLRERGARVAEPTTELFVNLAWPAERIRANIRKSYRSLIEQGKKEYSATLGVNILPLKRLHLEVAGRVTRPDTTWEAQQGAIDAGEAFCVYLLDKDENPVGGALFHRSRDEGLYAVGVYRRDLHDKPLGHLVQAFAIEHMQRLGLKWYHLGARPYEANEKELQIAHFKEGWATHSYPRLTAAAWRQ